MSTGCDLTGGCYVFLELGGGMEFCSILGFQNPAGNVGYWWRLPAGRPGHYREPRLGTGNTAATQGR